MNNDESDGTSFSPQLVTTADGSHTLFIPELNESYHSTFGALNESYHVFVEAGFEAVIQKFPEIHLLEVGFGTGLNALLTFLRAEEKEVTLHYTGIEPFPVNPELLDRINYPMVIGHPSASRWWSEIHNRSGWMQREVFQNGSSLQKWQGRAEDFQGERGVYQLVYLDAFAPAVQPELWTEDFFRKLAMMMASDGVLVTYSSKGEVRRNLRSAGFSVEKLAGPAGKREMVRATKISDE